jgi:hypothetical protein
MASCWEEHVRQLNSHQQPGCLSFHQPSIPSLPLLLLLLLPLLLLTMAKQQVPCRMTPLMADCMLLLMLLPAPLSCQSCDQIPNIPTHPY